MWRYGAALRPAIGQHDRATDDRDDREQRQLQLMRERVIGLADGSLYLATAIADLEGLLSALERTPEEWIDKFREEWSELEIAYAVALDRQTAIPTAASDTSIRNALAAMNALLDDRPTTNP